MKNVADVYHLTPVQRDVLNDPRSARVVQVRRKVHGELDSEAFEQAWKELLARHTMLRTCFLTQLEEPVQVVRQQVKLAYERPDGGDKPAKLDEWLEMDARHEFDPARAPLFRVMEIRLGARLFEIVLSYHPVLLDDRSVELMFEEVLSGSTGDAPAYREYVAWVERQDVAGVELFYRNQSRDVEICLDVKADKRPQALHGSDQMIGLLSNVLPLPITAPGETSLSAWFQEIESKRTKLQRYGHVSRSQIEGWLDLSDAPVPEPDQPLEFS